VTLCRDVVGYQCFRGPCSFCLHPEHYDMVSHLTKPSYVDSAPLIGTLKFFPFSSVMFSCCKNT